MGCPTQVGIYRYQHFVNTSRCRLPHASGDIPDPGLVLGGCLLAAPRKWGYTRTSPSQYLHVRGCPTQVGIYPLEPAIAAIAKRLPHASGDIPITVPLEICNEGAAPRKWGYTATGPFSVKATGGCPTQVGIYPRPTPYQNHLHRLPHASGDIPPLKTGTSIT